MRHFQHVNVWIGHISPEKIPQVSRFGPPSPASIRPGATAFGRRAKVNIASSVERCTQARRLQILPPSKPPAGRVVTADGRSGRQRQTGGFGFAPPGGEPKAQQMGWVLSSVIVLLLGMLHVISVFLPWSTSDSALPSARGRRGKAQPHQDQL